MKILALDTSTEYLSLALWLDGQILTYDVLAGQSHSQLILPALRALLNQAEISLQALDGIAFGAGPGSFTGLRIACGIAQGLAFGANLPVIRVSTLLALAHAAHAKDVASQHVIACLDARMGEVYFAAYEKTASGWHEALPAALYKPEAVPPLSGQGWVGIGSGWATYGNILQSVYADQLDLTLPDEHPGALSIAELALPLFAAGQGRPAAEAAPIYIRNKVALKMSERNTL
ncbi:MAG: tRNA (adenosine(37)-N6)-threonylcarbamoyltransferase complex dimerization subunit type 1 TsaB [Methylophilaceae bacterium]|nr:tRNA (adenosine(37)-N6)-threonylcarbamoyltransferase complex dimerization subunit type 1 TsaB [Methylophilaceae bacterium]